MKTVTLQRNTSGMGTPNNGKFGHDGLYVTVANHYVHGQIFRCLGYPCMPEMLRCRVTVFMFYDNFETWPAMVSNQVMSHTTVLRLVV